MVGRGEGRAWGYGRGGGVGGVRFGGDDGQQDFVVLYVFVRSAAFGPGASAITSARVVLMVV